MLWISMVLMICLGAYAAGYYLSMFVFVSHNGRAAPRGFDPQPETGVAILIPARDEGERAVRIIYSLLRQDHPGEIDIYLLLNDWTDSALPFLRDAFSETRDLAPDAKTTASRVIILERSNRRVIVVFTGVTGKSEKINSVTGGIRAPYTAIIDCDHQAHPAWIRSSLCLLREQDAQFIQGRRGPLSAAGFFRLWDSLHQHIGCELFNAAFARLGLTVFFTGTTAVIRTKLL